MEVNPEHLYRYTSIENLALILKRREMRLARLDKVDDLLESRSADPVNYGQYIFVTCWTDLEEESIPFWHMYTPRLTGVRLRMPLEMFNGYHIPDKPELRLTTDGFDNWALPFERMYGTDYMVMPEGANNFYKIEYTDDTSFVRRQLYTPMPDGSHEVALAKLGRYKSSHWHFQSEWRFRLIVVPGISPIPGMFDEQAELDRFLSASRQFIHGNPLSFEGFYLPIRDEAFSQMEVMLGPKHSSGGRAVVEALLHTYNPTAKLLVSTLKNAVQ